MSRQAEVVGSVVAIQLIQESINKLEEADKRLRWSNPHMHPNDYPGSVISALYKIQKTLAINLM